MTDLKLDILPAAQRALWNELDQIPSSFVLYGGTAMALRFGRRQSVDFDFFSNDHFQPETLLANLPKLKHVRVDQRGDNTLSIVADRNGPVVVSFFGDVQMNSVRPPDLVPDNRLRIASLLDLTATKLKTVQRRAEAKDYLDVAAALESGIGLPQALGAAIAIYGPTFNALAAIKALTYFGDGNLPSLRSDVKAFLQRSAEDVRIDALPQVQARPVIVGDVLQ